MDREAWVEKEVAEQEKKMSLDAHNKNVLRSMKTKEYDFWERQAVRIDNNSSHDDY